MKMADYVYTSFYVTQKIIESMPLEESEIKQLKDTRLLMVKLTNKLATCSVCKIPLKPIEGPSCEACFVKEYSQDAWDRYVGAKA